jgi:hypothetical protein
MNRHTGILLVLGIFFSIGGTKPAAAQHSGDVWIGRTEAGVLAISPSKHSFKPEENYVVLPASGGVLQGWVDDDPGFDALTLSTNGVAPLETGADIWLEAVAIDPPFRMINDLFQIIDEPGEASRFPGGSHLHEHWTWHIQSNHAQFDPNQCVWRATFFLRDEGSTGYQDSAPFTFKFTNVPLRDADGDFEQNGVVDLADVEPLGVCLFGPEATPAPDEPDVTTCEVECLNAFDFDADDDVDLADFAEWQIRFAE